MDSFFHSPRPRCSDSLLHDTTLDYVHIPSKNFLESVVARVNLYLCAGTMQGSGNFLQIVSCISSSGEVPKEEKRREGPVSSTPTGSQPEATP